MLDLSNGIAAAQGKVMFTDQATGQQVSPSNALDSNAPNRSSNNPQANFTEKASKGGLIGVADSLNYNTETGQSTANDVAFASVELQAHGYAKRLNRPNDSQYELDDVMFSTCPPTNRKWQFDAKSIDLDTDTGRGEAYNTTFRIADVPVFYLPYFNFPIDNRRTSGFYCRMPVSVVKAVLRLIYPTISIWHPIMMPRSIPIFIPIVILWCQASFAI